MGFKNEKLSEWAEKSADESSWICLNNAEFLICVAYIRRQPGNSLLHFDNFEQVLDPNDTRHVLVQRFISTLCDYGIYQFTTPKFQRNEVALSIMKNFGAHITGSTKVNTNYGDRACFAVSIN